MKYLGLNIRLLRERKGLSQVQLAKMVNIDNSTICKIEKGETESSIPTLRKIAVALGVTLTDLLKEESDTRVS